MNRYRVMDQGGYVMTQQVGLQGLALRATYDEQVPDMSPSVIVDMGQVNQRVTNMRQVL
ncbi:hypothetical protein D3C85_1864870 [compost metagenome]